MAARAAPADARHARFAQRRRGEKFGDIPVMIATYPLSSIVVTLALFVYIAFAMKVGKARAKYNVPAPLTDGPVEFQRVFRVHINTLEQIVIFLPALVIFASAWGDLSAAIVGVFWPLGRLLYARAYYAEAGKRGPGFGISFLSSVILLVGGLVGAVMHLAGRT